MIDENKLIESIDKAIAFHSAVQDEEHDTELAVCLALMEIKNAIQSATTNK